jgi:antitoxin PrlF
VAHYTGKITTSGKSEAIRLEKALFRSHPEFRQKADVRAKVVAPGHLLVSVEGGGRRAKQDTDPVMLAFLSFLERDIVAEPRRVKPLDAATLRKARDLTAGVVVSDDEVLPDDVTL